MQVLVAEDDLTSRAVLQAIISRWGFEVIAVANGNQAWEQLRKRHGPRLAVLDWMMPGLDGVEVCRKVRALAHPDPPFIILLTARRNKDDIVEGLKAGANDYIIKPYYNEELQARLGVGQRVVDLQRALRDRVKQLEDALTHVRTLQGILPICSYCHKIRSDKESWERLESYIVQHSEAKFTHGICPECMKKQLAELKK